MVGRSAGTEAVAGAGGDGPRTKLMRWIWIDRFTEFQSGRSATAVKNLSLAEDYFADHFPGYPVMPAALIL